MKKLFPVFWFFLLFFVFQTKVYAVTFTISNPNSNGEQVTFDVNISGLTSSSCPNTNCFLQAAFTKSGTSNYFGFTKGQIDWVKYNGSPDQDSIKSTFFSFTPVNGEWTGQLTIKIDPSDSGYTGPGDYDIKAWRYTGNSSSNSGSSDSTISTNLTYALPTPTPSSTPTPTPSPNIATPTPTPTSSPKLKPTPSSKPSLTLEGATPSASPGVLGLADYMSSSDANLSSASSQDPTGYQNSPNKKIAGILIASGGALILFALGFHFWYRKINKGKIHETKDPFEL